MCYTTKQTTKQTEEKIVSKKNKDEALMKQLAEFFKTPAIVEFEGGDKVDKISAFKGYIDYENDKISTNYYDKNTENDALYSVSISTILKNAYLYGSKVVIYDLTDKITEKELEIFAVEAKVTKLTQSLSEDNDDDVRQLRDGMVSKLNKLKSIVSEYKVKNGRRGVRDDGIMASAVKIWSVLSYKNFTDRSSDKKAKKILKYRNYVYKDYTGNEMQHNFGANYDQPDETPVEKPAGTFVPSALKQSGDKKLYVPPSMRAGGSTIAQAPIEEKKETGPSKYVPPFLRKKMERETEKAKSREAPKKEQQLPDWGPSKKKSGMKNNMWNTLENDDTDSDSPKCVLPETSHWNKNLADVIRKQNNRQETPPSSPATIVDESDEDDQESEQKSEQSSQFVSFRKGQQVKDIETITKTILKQSKKKSWEEIVEEDEEEY